MAVIGVIATALGGVRRGRRDCVRRSVDPRPRALSPAAEDVEAMTRYHIVPERSRVWIDARSNVHPIHSTTDGLEGFIDFDAKMGTDAQGGALVNVGENPAGKLSLRVDRLSSGNRLEDRELHKRVDARRYPDDRRRAHRHGARRDRRPLQGQR